MWVHGKVTTCRSIALPLLTQRGRSLTSCPDGLFLGSPADENRWALVGTTIHVA
jgi:hypothetical protein